MQLRRALAILLFAVPTALFGATRSVAFNGLDMGDCVAEPCRTIRYAIVVATPGDVVQVGPGKFGPAEITKPVAATRDGIAMTTFTSNVVGEGRVTAKIDGSEAIVTIVTAEPRRRAA